MLAAAQRQASAVLPIEATGIGRIVQGAALFSRRVFLREPHPSARADPARALSFVSNMPSRSRPWFRARPNPSLSLVLAAVFAFVAIGDLIWGGSAWWAVVPGAAAIYFVVEWFRARALRDRQP